MAELEVVKYQSLYVIVSVNIMKEPKRLLGTELMGYISGAKGLPIREQVKLTVMMMQTNIPNIHEKQTYIKKYLNTLLQNTFIRRLYSVVVLLRMMKFHYSARNP